jgi:hypothetical protein
MLLTSDKIMIKNTLITECENIHLFDYGNSFSFDEEKSFSMDFLGELETVLLPFLPVKACISACWHKGLGNPFSPDADAPTMTLMMTSRASQRMTLAKQKRGVPWLRRT